HLANLCCLARFCFFLGHTYCHHHPNFCCLLGCCLLGRTYCHHRPSFFLFVDYICCRHHPNFFLFVEHICCRQYHICLQNHCRHKSHHHNLDFCLRKNRNLVDNRRHNLYDSRHRKKMSAHHCNCCLRWYSGYFFCYHFCLIGNSYFPNCCSYYSLMFLFS